MALVAVTGCARTGAEGTGSPTTGYTGAEAGGEVFFPEHSTATPGVGHPGRLVEDGAGCIRLEISEDDPVAGGLNPTVLWPRLWSAERGKAGRVRIFGTEGRVVGRTGEERFLVGFILPTENPLDEVPTVDGPTKWELRSRCPGLYYFTAGFHKRFGPPFPRRGETTSS